MTRADNVIDGWKRMYVEGHWALDKFEAHVEAMLPVIPLEWYGEQANEPQSADSRWSMSAASAATRFVEGVTAYLDLTPDR